MSGMSHIDQQELFVESALDMIRLGEYEEAQTFIRLAARFLPADVQPTITTQQKPLFITLEEFEADSDEPEQLIEGVFETPSLAMVVGESGGGKSFFAIDLGLHIAYGKTWQGKAVKQGMVFYICSEGRKGSKRRHKAWRRHHGFDKCHQDYMVSNIPITLDNVGIRNLLTCIKSMQTESGKKPAFLIIDTMSRSLPADKDENSTRDINNFMNGCTEISNDLECVVLIVQHTGHADKSRARGSSTQRPALDCEILVDKSKNKIICNKSKDLEPFPSINFELLKVDGSCVITYSEEEAAARTIEPQKIKLTLKEKFALNVFDETLQAWGVLNGGDLSLERDIWRTEYFKKTPVGEYDTIRKAFDRATESLVLKGELQTRNGFYSKADRTGQNRTNVRT